MSESIKNQKSILAKLNITSLNAMQEEAQNAIHSNAEVVLCSPTGTGKTLAFLLPVIAELKNGIDEIQALIITPSRELAIQIEQVAREMGTGYKINLAYGGRSFSKDVQNMKQRPAILIGTPGRVADHLRRQSFSVDEIRFLVLDEFDKSLEIGFMDEMNEIIEFLPHLQKKILTSATHKIKIPAFVGLKDPMYLEYTREKSDHLTIKTVVSPSKDKLNTLVELLRHIGPEPGIIFCNYKASIQRISEFLSEHNIDHGCFFGGLDQKERERTLIKFRNGTHRIIVATDLAARGLDVPEIKFIIHYHLPLKDHEFIHRNGRTARMLQSGTAYVIRWEEEELPDFIPISDTEVLQPKAFDGNTQWKTIFISGGRKDKISKGDIVGLFMKQGHLNRGDLGVIELKQDCAFAAVSASMAQDLVDLLNNYRLKKKKIRLSVI